MAKLRIMFWNAGGLRRRIPCLRLLLSDNAVDIALINEMHLHPSFSANLPGYHVSRLDTTAETPRGGLLVAVRRRIVHHQLPDLDTQSFQSLGFVVHAGAYAIRVSAIYRPGSVRLKIQEVHRILYSFSPTLAAGDWNVKHPAWRCLSACQTGRRLRRRLRRRSETRVRSNGSRGTNALLPDQHPSTYYHRLGDTPRPRRCTT